MRGTAQLVRVRDDLGDLICTQPTWWAVCRVDQAVRSLLCPSRIGRPSVGQANAAPTVKMLIISFVWSHLHDDSAQISLPVDNSAAAITAATVVDGNVVTHTTLPSTQLLRTAGVLRVPRYLGHP